MTRYNHVLLLGTLLGNEYFVVFHLFIYYLLDVFITDSPHFQP